MAKESPRRSNYITNWIMGILSVVIATGALVAIGWANKVDSRISSMESSTGVELRNVNTGIQELKTQIIELSKNKSDSETAQGGQIVTLLSTQITNLTAMLTQHESESNRRMMLLEQKNADDARFFKEQYLLITRGTRSRNSETGN